MPIEYKTIERSNPQDRTKKKFYATAQKTGDTRMDELCEEIVQISALSKSDVYGVLYALLEVLPRHLATAEACIWKGWAAFASRCAAMQKTARTMSICTASRVRVCSLRLAKTSRSY